MGELRVGRAAVVGQRRRRDGVAPLATRITGSWKSRCVSGHVRGSSESSVTTESRLSARCSRAIAVSLCLLTLSIYHGLAALDLAFFRSRATQGISTRLLALWSLSQASHGAVKERQLCSLQRENEGIAPGPRRPRRRSSPLVSRPKRRDSAKACFASTQLAAVRH